MSGGKPWLTMPERITDLYRRAGYTRENFATVVMTSREVVQHWERFEDVPSLIELGQLANGLRVSKYFLCFGEDKVVGGKRGEPDLTDEGIRAALSEAGATDSEQQLWHAYRHRTHKDNTHSRTFVFMFVRALRTALEDGVDQDIAMTRALVVATQAHYLARAVALGVRPVRNELLRPPPRTLSPAAQAEYIAAEIHRVSGIKPPVSAKVLAVAMGHRLVPTFGTDSLASRMEADRQDELNWKPMGEINDDETLIINGFLRIKAWQFPGDKPSDTEMTKRALNAARNYAQAHAQTPKPEPSVFGLAFFVSANQLVMATPTELGNTTTENWVRPALRDFARRDHSTAIYVISDESVSVCAAGGGQRYTIIVDVENRQAEPLKRTYVATTGEDGALGAWSEDLTRARFSDLLPGTVRTSPLTRAKSRLGSP